MMGTPAKHAGVSAHWPCGCGTSARFSGPPSDWALEQMFTHFRMCFCGAGNSPEILSP